MRFAIGLAALVTLVRCSTPAERRQSKLMDEIEARVRLPKGAAPLSEYARFYAEGRPGEVISIYLIPDPQPPADAQCYEVQPNMSSKVVDCDSVPAAPFEKVKANERQWIEHQADLPGVNDGGCGMITVFYLPSSQTVESATCNGEA